MQRIDQAWPKLLLPDIYHAHEIINDDRYMGYGGLRGDLPIFLALIAFSTQPEWLKAVLPTTFVNGEWRTHDYPVRRKHQRGVVVSLYTAPSTWAGGSTSADLVRYEENGYFC